MYGTVSQSNSATFRKKERPLKKTALITIAMALGTLCVLAVAIGNNPRTAKGNPPGAGLPNPPSGMAAAPGTTPGTTPSKPATGMGTASPPVVDPPVATPPVVTPTPTKDGTKTADPVVPPTATKDATKTDPVMPEPEEEPPADDICANGPFSYEYVAGDKILGKPDNKIIASVYGPNYSCFLVALHHKTMSGTVPGVLARLKKKSAKALKRFWTKFEVRLRKYTWNTMDSYVGDKARLFDTDHKGFLKSMDVTRLLLEHARYHDIIAVDRFHPSHHYSYGSSSKRKKRSKRSKRSKRRKRATAEPPSDTADPKPKVVANKDKCNPITGEPCPQP